MEEIFAVIEVIVHVISKTNSGHCYCDVVGFPLTNFGQVGSIGTMPIVIRLGI